MSNLTPMGVLPAEWALQSAILLVWPHAQGDWAVELDAIESVYDHLAAAISRRQIVLITCFDSLHQNRIADRLHRHGECHLQRVRFFVAPTNDTWVRDTGPLTIVDPTGRNLALNFRFNGWGGKYPAEQDDALTAALAAQGAFQCEVSEIDLVLEGGSIDVNGDGCALTTTACLLAWTRNPSLSRAQIEERLRLYLGISKCLWLEHGFLAGDDTDSHIDMLARFCDARTICYTACSDPDDPHYGELVAMAAQLQTMRNTDGSPFRLIPLPWPQPKWTAEGERLPASYANFLIINGAVLVPTYDDPADATALQTFRDIFPDREIIPIPSLALIHQRGSVHCATMQLPAGVVG